jgi:hypothetical protein
MNKMHYMIDEENTIFCHEVPPAATPGTTVVSTEKELLKAAKDSITIVSRTRMAQVTVMLCRPGCYALERIMAPRTGSDAPCATALARSKKDGRVITRTRWEDWAPVWAIETLRRHRGLHGAGGGSRSSASLIAGSGFRVRGRFSKPGRSRFQRVRSVCITASPIPGSVPHPAAACNQAPGPPACLTPVPSRLR